MISRSTTALFAFALLAAACGGKTDDLSDSGTDDSGKAKDGSAGDSSPPGPDCPVTAPTEGSSCSKESIQCEYGSDPRSTCNQVFSCTQGAWSDSLVADPSCPTPTTNPSVCPATQADVPVGDSCSDLGTTCNYTTSSVTSFCGCFEFGVPIFDGGPSGTWSCGGAFETGCPKARPRIGSVCTQPDLNCNYDSCGVPNGLAFQCNGPTGTWIMGFGDVCAGAN